MKIDFVSGCPYEDNPDEVLNIEAILDEGEVVHLGDTIDIPMMDDTFLKREVKIINPRCVGDYAAVSMSVTKDVESGEYGKSKTVTTVVEGKCRCTLVVMNVPYHDVKTEDAIKAQNAIAERKCRVCLTPYKEFTGNKNYDSIRKHTQSGYTVPNKVIKYLQVGDAYMMCPGIYEHPFKPGVRLLGPYFYSDGHYYWDRDTWKYVLKYNLTLPQDFIDYVMSDAGTEFIETRIHGENAWTEAIKDWKTKEGTLCLLPDDAGDIDLKDF